MAGWYCAIDGRQYGPVDQAVLWQWAHEGRIRPTDMVWAEGWPAWVPAGGVGGMFTGAPPPPETGGTVGIAPPGGTGGQTPITGLMAQGWRALKGRYGIALGFSLLFALITGAAGSFGVVAMIVLGPFMLGHAVFFLALLRGGRPRVGLMFEGFQNFGPALGTYMLMVVFIYLAMFVGMLLGGLAGAVPGLALGGEAGLITAAVIAVFCGVAVATVIGLRYSQAFYCLADDRSLGPLEALRASRALMRGRKLKLFGLQLLMGLILVPASLLTCFIGSLLLAPWYTVVLVKFYEDLAPPREADPSQAEAGPGRPASQCHFLTLPGPTGTIRLS